MLSIREAFDRQAVCGESRCTDGSDAGKGGQNLAISFGE